MATDSKSRRPSNWPPVLTLIIGLVLVFVAFPNPLRIPNNNPNATAELAPVPGKQQSQQNSNFSQTGLASSSGLGSGTQDFLAPPPPRIGQDIPLEKDCIEGRQTEDSFA